MPYIKSDIDRIHIDKIVESMKEVVQPDGRLNYLLFKFCKDTISPSYQNYRNFIAELTECGAEIRRRFLAPYEEEQCRVNGDVQ
ncbi:MAG: hypothetical protein M0R17_03225 [Candidatus Omnitrophica bacterium]|jgi:hypothetical protein|nr:hypothetical protein [Candidatus Omnitrophota bacterium]